MIIQIGFEGKDLGLIHIPRIGAMTNENIIRYLSSGARLIQRKMKERLHQGGTLKISRAPRFSEKGKIQKGYFQPSPYEDLRTRTGAYRSSITVEPRVGAERVGVNGYRIKIGPRVIYAKVHEFGAPPVIIPVTEKMRRFVCYMGIFFRKTTTHLNIRKRAVIKPTLEENRGELILLARRMIWGVR